MPDLRRAVSELEKVIRALRRTRNLAGTLQTEQQEVDDQTVILKDEGRELQTSNHAIAVGVVHVLVVELHVVLGGDVIGEVVVHDQAKEPVQERQVNLLVHL